jgi:hypothetical protein
MLLFFSKKRVLLYLWIKFRGDDIKPGETIKKMFTTQHDLVYIEQIEMNFTKKSTFLGLFPNKDSFKFDKVKLTNLEANET